MKDLLSTVEEFRDRLASPVEDDDPIGEVEVAEYMIFVLGLDTYIRHIEEATGEENPTDPVIAKGIRILKNISGDLERIQNKLEESLPSDNHRRMLGRALRYRPTVEGSGRQAMLLRTLLDLGGPKTVKGIFGKNRKLQQQVRTSINASELDDGDAAMDLFAAMPLRNARIRQWMDWAAESAQPITTSDGMPPADSPPTPTAVEQASSEAMDKTAGMLARNVEVLGADAMEDVQKASVAQTQALQEIQDSATEAARQVLEQTGEPDVSPTKSETAGIATAAAMAVVTDPSNPQNIPPTLSTVANDPEQLSAALTDGQVLVAAGAGSGKSRTLIARVNYLLQTRGCQPEKVLVTSFNKDAADNLQFKIGQAVGDNNSERMQIGTMHGLFTRYIRRFGNPEEIAAIGRGPDDPGGFVGSGSSVARVANQVYTECFAPRDMSDEEKKDFLPKAKEMMRYKSVWAGNRLSPAEAKAQVKNGDVKGEIAAQWYEIYEGLKGAIPGWAPPCRSPAMERFMARRRKMGAARLADFDDQLTIFESILAREPKARKQIQQELDHILVDEAQDLNSVQGSIIQMMSEHVLDEEGNKTIGEDGGPRSLWLVGDDKQCVASDTLILTEKGEVSVSSLKVGDRVISYRNGDLVPQIVRHVNPSAWTKGFKVITESGKTLTMSPNHKIWAGGQDWPDSALQLIAHGPKGSEVTLRGNTTSSRWFTNYRDALAFAEELSRNTGIDLSHSIFVPDSDPLQKITASELAPEMVVIVVGGSSVVLDRVVSVEEVSAEFLDLDVNDASNFFGGGILSHNSIYEFRGANPAKFIEKHENPKWETRSIKTNYRCPPEVVDIANKLIAHNEGQIPMAANPSPARSKGMNSIRVESPESTAEASYQMALEIKNRMETEGLGPGDFAIIARTNAELNALEQAFLTLQVPYACKGSASFLGAPETRAVLGYTQIALGDNPVKMQKAFETIISEPNKFFIKGGPKAAAEKVQSAFRTYAMRNRLDIKSLNPMDVMADPTFRRDLLAKIKGFDPDNPSPRLSERQIYGLTRGFEEDLDVLENLFYELQSLRDKASSGSVSTQELFDDILSMKGVAFAEGRRVSISFRDSLAAQIRDKTGDDEDDEEEIDEGDETLRRLRGLGNVGFLYKLAEADPNDPEDQVDDPSTPIGFRSKMERIMERVRGGDLRTDLNKFKQEQRKKPVSQREVRPAGAVYLGTAHSTKGLQFPHAYVLMPKGVFPMVRKDDKKMSPEELDAKMEQERRLAYVALTRTEGDLTVVCPQTSGTREAGISPFVEEAGLHIGENVLPPSADTPLGGGTSKQAFVYEDYPDEDLELEDDPDLEALNWQEEVGHA